MRRYIEAAANLYDDAKLPNPFTTNSLEVNYSKVLIQALEKYEKVPYRKEAIADPMFEHI